MTANQVLKALEGLGIRLTIRDGKLFCPTPSANVPERLREALARHKEEILARVSEGLERERLAWVMTPDGPAKVWAFAARFDCKICKVWRAESTKEAV